VHHRDVDGPRQRFGVADLHRQPLQRPVQHGLAVKSDDIDVFPRNVVVRREGRDRLGVGRGHHTLGLAQNAGPRVAIRQLHRLGQRLAQHAALGLAVGPVAGRPERFYAFAVGLDQGDIDPVQRRSAHQPYGSHHHWNGPFDWRNSRPTCIKQPHSIMPQRTIGGRSNPAMAASVSIQRKIIMIRVAYR
jgi:hypothetical protein